MPVQIDHDTTIRTEPARSEPARTGPTAAGPAQAVPVRSGPATHPVVAVLGRSSRVAGLPPHLPSGWEMRLVPDIDAVRPGELLVLSGATVHDVRLARAVLPPATRIVALIDDFAAAELVSGVLTAGADVCVRGGHPGILAGHLVACRRRQLADRWAGLTVPQI